MKIKHCLMLVLMLIATPARAELEINIAGAMRDPMPLAMPEMIHDGFFVGQYAKKIRNVVIADLERSGLFRILPENSYIQELTSMSQEPAFVDWRAINAHALVQSSVSELDANNLRVEFRLWDVPAETQMKGQSFTTTKSNWRRVAHVIADAIYERLTGEKGYFDTRIVYVSETGPATRRVKRLAIMDQDGENHKFLNSGAAMSLTPRFSPNLQKITYMSYSGGTPKVYILDIETGAQKLIGNFPGMTFAPRFSPDSNKLLLSYANRGQTDIYEMDLNSGRSTRLTSGGSINTSPSYSPDGEKIVFNSDRGGNQQLYVMDADGSNVHRISFNPGRYATPVWSPRGDYIAFTKMIGGQFCIGVMYPEQIHGMDGERILSCGYLKEGPTWSPNGRGLMFFAQDKAGGPVKLMSIDLNGHNERVVMTPSDGSDPAWSPLLP